MSYERGSGRDGADRPPLGAGDDTARDAEDDAVADVLGDWFGRGSPESADDLVHAHPEIAGPLRAALRASDAVAREAGPSPAASSRPTTVGEFRIVREIGRGGMGVVYEAEQASLGRRVALKLLHPAVAPSGAAVERFRREARAASRLAHPHLVAIHAMGEADGVWYIAMERVRGTTLAEEIGRRRAGGAATRSVLGSPADGRRHFERLARVFADAADALDAAHGAGVIHRDVKPDNLILDAEGEVKVADFGLALVAGESSRTLTGDLLGTPAYMSPEQAAGGHLPMDARTDVYSLGATLYEALTLVPPFSGPSAHAVCVEVLSREPRGVRLANPSVPRDLARVVEKAMEKDPRRRYESAGAFAADLRAFADGREVVAPRRSLLRRAAAALRRRPAALAVLAIVATLVAALGVAALAFLRGDPSTAPSPSPERLRAAASPWRDLPSIPVASSGLATAFVAGRLFAISGFQTPRVSAYDPAAATWRPAAALSASNQYAAVAVIEGRIYLAGGDGGGTGALASLLVYDPATDAWSERAPMPGGPRWAAGAAAIDGRLYVVGGSNFVSPDGLSRLEVFDPVANAWQTRAPMPETRVLSGGVAAIEGRLYVAGGNRGVTPSRRLDVYDPATDRWSARAAPPMGISTQAVVVDGRLVLVGGGLDGDESAVLAYEPTTDAWSRMPPLSRGRRAHGVAYDPDSRTLYAVSGYRDGGWIASVESYVVPRPAR